MVLSTEGAQRPAPKVAPSPWYYPGAKPWDSAGLGEAPLSPSIWGLKGRGMRKATILCDNTS